MSVRAPLPALKFFKPEHVHTSLRIISKPKFKLNRWLAQAGGEPRGCSTNFQDEQL